MQTNDLGSKSKRTGAHMCMRTRARACTKANAYAASMLMIRPRHRMAKKRSGGQIAPYTQQPMRER